VAHRSANSDLSQLIETQLMLFAWSRPLEAPGQVFASVFARHSQSLPASSEALLPIPVSISQLLDRFALCVDIQGIPDPDARVEILKRRVRYEQDPERFYQEWVEAEARLSQRIAEAQELLPQVTYREQDLYTIAALTSEMEVDGHRADIVILKAAIAQAAFEGRTSVQESDILLAAELALPHRLRRQPFEDTQEKLAKLEQRLEEAREGGAPRQEPRENTQVAVPSKKKQTP